MTLEDRLAVAFLEEQPADAAHALERLPLEERVMVLRLAPAAACEALRAMSATAAVESLTLLPSEDGAAALGALPIDDAVALLRRMPPVAVEGLLGQLPAERRAAFHRTLKYPVGTAGALMDPDVLAVPDAMSLAEARVRLRRSPRGLLYYVYVVDRDHRLVGVLDIPELMRADGHAAMASVMRRPVDRLLASAPAVAVRTHPGWRAFHAMPVVDDDERLVGAIRYQTLRRLESEATLAGGVPASVTVTALGELFHLGLAGFVEGVAAVSAPRAGTERPRPATGIAEGGTR